MMKPNLKSTDLPTMIVPPLGDDPAYSAAAGIARDLGAALDRVRAELDLLDLEHHFDSIPRATHDSPRNRILRDRLNRRRAELADGAKVVNRSAPAAAVPKGVALALDLIAGKPAKLPPTRTARNADLKEREDILEAALGDQREIVEGARRDASRKICSDLAERHTGMIRTMFEHALALSRAVDRERAFRAEILAAGYEIAPELISPPPISAPLTLGSERHHDSQISGWRRLLEQRGVIK